MAKALDYLKTIRRLMNLKRYQNLYLFKQRSVAEHSWSVAKIAQLLAYMEIKRGNAVNLGKLLEKAICHDELEIFTGDILSGTKRRTSEMEKAVGELEEIVFNEEYLKTAPEIPGLKELVLYGKDDTIEGKILSAADIIDTVYESMEEIELGNRAYFEKVMRGAIKKLKQIDVNSVQAFVEYLEENPIIKEIITQSKKEESKHIA